jgi:hypothetical protein
LAFRVTSKKRPVVSSDRPAPQRTLGAVIVDLQIAVTAVTRERRPVLQRYFYIDDVDFGPLFLKLRVYSS